MGDPGAMAAQVRMKRPGLTRLEGKVVPDTMTVKLAGKLGPADYDNSDTTALQSEISASQPMQSKRKL